MVYVNVLKKWTPSRIEVEVPKQQEIPAEPAKESVEDEKPKRGRKPKNEQ